MKLIIRLVFGLFLLTLPSCSTEPMPALEVETPNIEIPLNMFVGTYTRDEGWVNGQGEGIYQLTINYNDSSLQLNGPAAELINPTFLALSPDKKNLYSVSEIGDGDGGYLYAYAIDENMNLTFIDRYSSRGQSPVHISVDASGKFVFAANYNGGVGIVFTRNEDGSLQFAQQLNHSGSGPHPNQNASHLHMAKLSPDNNFLFFPDLGSDKIWSYRIDYESATLTKTNQEFGSVAAGAGPRHMDFHPSGNFAFVVNELNSTVTVFAYDFRSGALTKVQTISTLPEGFTAWNSSADIHVHPNGLFLYASNRGHNSIVTFSVDPATGELAVLGQTPTEGETPRNFAVAPTGDFLFVANQNSNNITVFTIGAGTGLPEFTGNQLEVPTPVCLVFY